MTGKRLLVDWTAIQPEWRWRSGRDIEQTSWQWPHRRQKTRVQKRKR